MSSEAVENARKLTRQLSGAAITHAQPAAAKIDEEREAAGKKPLQLAAACEESEAELQACFSAYEGKEDVVVRESNEDNQARADRDKLSAKLRSKLSGLSQSVGYNYGTKIVERFKLSGATPDAPDRVLKMAQSLLAATKDGFGPLPEPEQSWNAPNLKKAREDIAEKAPLLAGSLKLLVNETKQSQTARLERDKAAAVWHRTSRLSADLSRTVLRYAKQDELAKKVVPSSRHVDRGEPMEEPE